MVDAKRQQLHFALIEFTSCTDPLASHAGTGTMHAADGMLAMLLSPSKGYPRISAGCEISMNGV
jgi:hypothetical protein